MTQAIDIITGALQRCNAYQPGETLSSTDQNAYLTTLNDLLDSLSNDHNFVYGTKESIFQWVPGKNQYTIGNPSNVRLGYENFAGNLTAGSNVITGISQQPTGLVIGCPIEDVQNLLSSEPQFVTAIGTNTITFGPGRATANSQGLDSFLYSVPGDFPITRPLRITGGFTRFNNLDFTLEVYATQDQYNQILYKAQPGPWPSIAWYNPTMPYGLLNVYMTPGNAAELHLFTDTLLTGFVTVNTTVDLPIGYVRSLKWLLANELWPELFGDKDPSQTFKKNVADSFALIKAMNAQPASIANYDRALLSAKANAAWIFTGGY